MRYKVGIVCVILAIAGFIYWKVNSCNSFLPLHIGTRLCSSYQQETAQGLGKIVVGDGVGTLKPQLTLSKWEDNFLKVSYPLMNGIKPKAEDNGIVWEKEGQTLSFKHVITPTHQPPTDIKVNDTGTIRVIKNDSASLSKISTSYQLFEQRKDTTPIISTFIPNEWGFIFFGTRPSELDLENPQTIPLSISRIKTDNGFTCPVVLMNPDQFVVMYYYPGIGQNGEAAKDKFLAALNAALQKNGVEGSKIRRYGDFFFYMDGITPKQIGRVAADKNMLIFDIYTKSPYVEKLKQYMRPTFQKVRNDILFSIGGLDALNPQINASIVDSVVESFAHENNYNIKNDTYTSSEMATYRTIDKLQQDKEWVFNGKSTQDVPNNPPDKFEFDITLTKKPATNVFSYDIDTKGLDFYYQPPLTEAQKDSGEYRPEDIVGSYSVYRNDGKNTYASAKEAEKYTTGKAFQIYRPKIYDSHGNYVWGELSVDTEKGKLSVTINKDFLAEADYPVVVDPTFGYTTIGATQDTTACLGNMSGSLFAGSQGILNSITVYMHKGSVSPIFGIYDGSQNLVAQVNTLDTTDVGPSWISQTFSSPPSLSNANYILVAGQNATGGKDTCVMFYDTGGANQGKTQAVSGASLPSTASFTSNNREYSIYATYTAPTPTPTNTPTPTPTDTPTPTPTPFKMNLKGNVNLRGNVNLK